MPWMLSALPERLIRFSNGIKCDTPALILMLTRVVCKLYNNFKDIFIFKFDYSVPGSKLPHWKIFKPPAERDLPYSG